MIEQAHTYPMPPHVTVLRFLTQFLGRTIIVCAAISLLVIPGGLLLEEHVLDIPYQLESGLDKYLRMFMGIVMLGGVFGLAVVLAIVNDIYRACQKRILDRIVENADEVPLQGPPVGWQRTALSEGRIGTAILGLFGVVIGPCAVIAAIILMVEEPRDARSYQVLVLVSITITVLSIIAISSYFKAKSGPAQELWKGARPELVRREPSPEHDADGNVTNSGKRDQANSRKNREALANSPANLQLLARIDAIAGKVLAGSIWGFVIGGMAVIGLAMLRQPCRMCEQISHGPALEWFIDAGLLVANILLFGGLVLLLVSTVFEAVVVLRLRRTVVDLAADPKAPSPPWFLLRRLILEESPLAPLTGHLHTAAVACAAFGVTAWFTRDEYPMYLAADAIPWLLTLAGMLALFHTSAWFWKRPETLEQNRMLLERWPK